MSQAKEHWKYLGAKVPHDVHEVVDGKPCYYFLHQLNAHSDVWQTWLIISRESYWGRGTNGPWVLGSGPIPADQLTVKVPCNCVTNDALCEDCYGYG